MRRDDPFSSHNLVPFISHPNPSDFRVDHKFHGSGFFVLLVLDEAKVLGVLAEALAADVELVLADEGLLVAAHDAAAATLAHADLLARAPLVEMAHCVVVGVTLVLLGE